MSNNDDRCKAFGTRDWAITATHINKGMSTPSGHGKHVSTSQEDELDEWDARIQRGGCMQEHLKLQDCYMDTKDWRKCKDEVHGCYEFSNCRWKHLKSAGH